MTFDQPLHLIAARPFAVGGEATAANLEMRCRAHNGFEWTRHLDAESESLAER